MARYLTIRGEEVRLKVELDEGPTAKKIRDRLPFETSASRWGDEIYFQIPVSADLEDGARETVEVGDVAYWPQGEALCLFFGPTPASTDEEPRAASPVTVVGRISEGLENVGRIAPGENLKVEKPAE
ncbi:MAG: cyclophilin-like fold protein [Actinomycetota bacterium]|nr:cyclophilin-like fold protein [Actinomycetota bacterium]